MNVVSNTLGNGLWLVALRCIVGNKFEVLCHGVYSIDDSCGYATCGCVKYTGERFAALRVRGASIGTAVAWCVDLAEQLKSRVSSLTLGDVKAKREC